MSTLHFAGRLSRATPTGRMVYTAHDDRGRLYTIGINTDGSHGFAAVYDPATLETLYSKTCFTHRIHPDELKKTLQAVADGFAATHTTEEITHR